jgi:transposase
LLLVWDNASWHVSREVRNWIKAHNRVVKETGSGVRIVSCPLPSKSPWLNPIEPKWVHSKRRIVEPERLLSGQEIAERVCQALECPYHEHIPIPKKVP